MSFAIIRCFRLGAVRKGCKPFIKGKGKCTVLLTFTNVNGIAPLEASQVIENVTDLAQYGLTEPQKTITVETAAKSYILYVGDKNDLTSSYYVCFPSTSTVYVVSATDINRFNYGLDELVEEETETSAEESASPAAE